MREIKIQNQEHLVYCERLVRSYLEEGSVEDVLINNPTLGVSITQFHNILNSWGIIGSPGRNSLLSETIYFFDQLLLRQIPLARLHKLMPRKFETSLSTLFRIYRDIKRGFFPRQATALIISPPDHPELVLIGRDVSVERLNIGKLKGALTIPATFSLRSESAKNSILRVIQQEVFTEKAIERNIPKNLIPEDPKPFMRLGLADVQISVYALPLNFERLGPPSSAKLSDMKFLEAEEILESIRNSNVFRAGSEEVAEAYLGFLNKGIYENNKINVSEFNFLVAGAVAL